jgi:L-amino acid N-acyltransferase YncA
VITRPATAEDAAAIARIYNQGIEDRVATFETRLRSHGDVLKWFDGVHPIVVAEEGGQVMAFAGTSVYRLRDCYAGIAECSVYVERGARGRGAGRAVLIALHDAARAAGFHKLVSRVFPENATSLKMLDSLSWTRVGVYRRHGQLDGVWRDVIIVEKLL